MMIRHRDIHSFVHPTAIGPRELTLWGALRHLSAPVVRACPELLPKGNFPTMNPIIVIPSRLASTRLPAKALADIGGEPMIVRVARRARDSGVARIVVAAGDEAIAEAVAPLGIEAVLTPPDLPSGADRVHAALDIIDPAGLHDVAINLQGDLPLIDPEVARIACLPLEDGFDIGTLVAPIADEYERQASSVVKVACAFTSERPARALYFSRATIPWGDGPVWHHVGIYAWRRAALARFVALPRSPLEAREGLEQLRALEAGMTIGCMNIAHAPLGVDTAEDLARVRAALAS
ncbi:3-deoxy-D-manno-octulosonate cytidylyltransferase [Tanticharoenia sakaeratensis NBRC 103193]|nr:3-deoxy-D-manno-octulosonate cytidylyltransferase [Tanticharoenia sakaeratensis NBRC 103193]